jgi:branched-chain amino acid transport system ATP-binding protein
MLLELSDVSVSYGPVRALHAVSVAIDAGEVVALLGANGAGKSTALRAVSGLVAVESGRVVFDGEPIGRVRAHRLVERGLAHAPEGRRIFGDMTVAENLQMGAHTIHDRAARNESLERVFHYFPLLADRRGQQASTLSGGEQQMLAVGRALMSRPKLLMLDEPSLGLAPKLVDQIFEIIGQINRQERVAIFLVEQNANEALLRAHRAYVLENGRITLTGPARQLRQDPRVVEAYLGG